jgi:adenosylhomocysteine nucleosidase
MNIDFIEDGIALSKLKVAIVLADESELSKNFKPLQNHKLFISGIGKVNAAFKVIDIIYNFSPDLIINMGTAGHNKLVGDNIYQCTQFIQRDMDVTPLGYQEYVTPCEETKEQILINKYRKTNLPQAICGTGDNFCVNDTPKSIWDLAEMEGYVFAKACLKYNIPFLCFKIISDNADENSKDTYKESLKTIPEKLLDLYNSISK